VNFHRQSFAARHNTMGDVAELIYDTVYDGQAHPLGLNRYWMNGKRLTLTAMTDAMRYTPDRMSADGYVEVMGCGRDQLLKLKTEKLKALQQWAALGPVNLFVYDSKNHRYWEAPLEQWDEAIADHADLGTFPEGKTYWSLHTRHFPSTPKEAPRAHEQESPVLSHS
jgi:hypothetical protein